MGRRPRNWLDGVRDDVLTAVIVAIAVALASGFAAAVLSGTWQKALLAASGLGILVAVVMLSNEALRHAQELGEVKFDEVRAKDAKKRQLPKYERDQRDHITRAAARPLEAASQSADVSTMLERGRQHISSGRAAPLGLLLVSDAKPNSPKVVAQAGRFDQAVLASPSQLIDWIESLGDSVYPALLPVDGEPWRVLGVGETETPLDDHDKFEIQRMATHLGALKLAHRAAEGGSFGETA
jgi:hypothetical protein